MRKSFLLIGLASTAMFITSACIITTTEGDGGSGGGTGGTDSTSSSSSSGTTSSSSSGGGTGGAGGSLPCDAPIDQVNMCYACNEWITFTPCVGGKLCAAAAAVYDKYAGCICDAANCLKACDGSCAGNPDGNTDQAACDTCVVNANKVDPAVAGSGACETNFQDCANN